MNYIPHDIFSLKLLPTQNAKIFLHIISHPVLHTQPTRYSDDQY